jgi:formylglycine-generating enzyme
MSKVMYPALLIFAACREIPEGMVWIEGGAFEMGSDAAYVEEGPRHEVFVDGFFIDRHEVTNREFAAFVAATGYMTMAEKLGDSGVFVVPEDDQPMSWWRAIAGASWKNPEGAGLEGRADHPVVHVAFEDASAYCAWTKGQLPTEAQWERAAGSSLPHGNIWTGAFPRGNDGADGFVRTAPVGSYAPNARGLYDMAGNVWEWTQDWYATEYYRRSPYENPRGPAESEARDANEPGVAKKTIRGGSHLCSPKYCSRFRATARSATTPDTSLGHLGFRCVK